MDEAVQWNVAGYRDDHWMRNRMIAPGPAPRDHTPLV
jgi:hypothetical protein